MLCRKGCRKRGADKIVARKSYPSESKEKCNKTSTTISDLNDHVVREICQHLDDISLSTVADVSTIFRRNALAEFTVRNQTQCLQIPLDLDEGCYYRRGKDFIGLRQLLSVFRNFGPAIKWLNVSLYGWNFQNLRFQYSQLVMQLIIQYCDQALNNLTLCGFMLTSDTTPKLRPLLLRMQQLHFIMCRWKSDSVASGLLSLCPELQKFSITFGGASVFRDPFPFSRLKSLKIVACHDVDNASIENFLGTNPHLEELEIRCCENIRSDVFRSFTQHIPQIEKLDLCVEYNHDAFIEDAEHLKHLTVLKSLKMKCHDHSFSPVINELVAAHVPLEVLQLIDCVANTELAQGIAGLIHLKELKLNNAPSFQLSDIFIFVSALSELNNLQVEVSNLQMNSTNLVDIIRLSAATLWKLEIYLPNPNETKLEEADFNKILEIIRQRDAKLCFELTLHSKVGLVINVPRKLMNAFENTLKIIVKCPQRVRE